MCCANLCDAALLCIATLLVWRLIFSCCSGSCGYTIQWRLYAKRTAAFLRHPGESVQTAC